MDRDLKLEAVTLEYQNHGKNTMVCQSLSVTFPEKKVSVILGPSGVGKTTLLNFIAGHFAGEGTITFQGKRLDSLPPSEREIAYVTQDFRLYPHMTVFENIAFPLHVLHAPREEIEKRVNAIASRLGISYFLSRKPRALSGGQQQKVALAKALIWEPSLLLLDEPFSDLDPQSRQECRLFFKETLLHASFTTLLVTHSWDDAMTLADRVYLLHQGKIAFEGTPYEAECSAYAPYFSEVRP